MKQLEDIKNRLAASNFGPLSVAMSDDRRWTLLLEHSGTEIERRVALCVDDDEADTLAHAPDDIARLVKALEMVMEQVEALDGLADQPFSHDVILAFQLASRGIRKAITESLD